MKARIALAAVITATIAALLGGCAVRTPPCHTECWWSHGRQLCERRCY